MKVLNVEKLRIEKDGSKTEAWFDLTVVGENDEEEKILTSKNTKVSIQRSLRIDNKTARFTIILKNE